MCPRSHQRSGQSLVEFALLLPVLTMLMVGTIDLARVFYAKVTIANASRVAAEFAANPIRLSLNDDDPILAAQEVEGKAVEEAGGLVPVTASFNGTFEPGTKYTVTVTAQFAPITPIIAQLVGGNSLAITHSTELRHNCTATSTCNY